ncbi:hypothetical protein AALK14_18525 [Butyricimonas hominis]|uniref:hypothetical protein n=1 Tax=Butyricimonas TaxID=574697 RepID=UPI003518AE00
MEGVGHFVVGLFSTYCINVSFVRMGCVSITDAMLSHVVSIVGGVLSAVVVAWLRERWGRKKSL